MSNPISSLIKALVDLTHSGPGLTDLLFTPPSVYLQKLEERALHAEVALVKAKHALATAEAELNTCKELRTNFKAYSGKAQALLATLPEVTAYVTPLFSTLGHTDAPPDAEEDIADDSPEKK